MNIYKVSYNGAKAEAEAMLPDGISNQLGLVHPADNQTVFKIDKLII